MSPKDILFWVSDYFSKKKVALASSLSLEDQMLTDMIIKNDLNISIFTLDTGRLPQETYDLISETMKHYSMKYDVLFPDRKAVEEMEREYGPNLFYDSIDKRKKCCYVRKMEALKRKLFKLEAWVCGLRREQSVTRTKIEKIEWDQGNQLLKINPLADCSQEEVIEYVRANNVPYNSLHDKGYLSIGCAPCTRAVKAGEDIRAGRWWWEPAEQKECGLHCAK